jgi:hypothetical protein
MIERYSLVFVGCLAGLVGCTSNADVAPPSGCAQDPNVVGCEDPSTGFSCGNGERPDQSDSSLVCSDGVTSGDGLILYCCVQFTSSTCEADPSVQGCTGSSFGFSCTGTDSPSDADSSLNCSQPTDGGNGELLYCCTD